MLRAGDVSSEVFDGGGVFAGEAVGLGFDAGFVDEDAGVGGEAGEGEDASFVDGYDFTDGSGILKPGDNIRITVLLQCQIGSEILSRSATK